jgi:hypothetical protein
MVLLERLSTDYLQLSATTLDPKQDMLERICAQAQEAVIEREYHICPNPSAIA